MKQYIFLTFSIIDVGGGQLYVRNKTAYLESQGWSVKIFSAMEGEIRIPELKQYNNGIIKNIAYAPQIYSNTRQEHILNKMCCDNNNYAEIIIESHSFIFGLWGELLAKKLNAKHLLFTIEERNRCLSKSHFDFILYKWNQKLLVGISTHTLHSFFLSQNVKIAAEESYRLPAYCQNVIENIPSPLKIDKNNKTICLFGRLDKPFIKETARSIAKYIELHPNLYFNVVILGGGDKKTLSFIKNIFNGVFNCNILLTGYLFPIPYELLSQMNVVVTSAGCSWVSKKIGITTITIDGNDLKPIGILGYTTNNSLFRQDEPIVELNVLLDLVLFKDEYRSTPIAYQKELFDFSNHIDFINDAQTKGEYYDIRLIKIPLKYKLVSKIKYSIYSFLGRYIYVKLSNYKNRRSR